MFEWAGGLPALTRLTRLFYENTPRTTPCSRRCSRPCRRPPAARRHVARRGLRRPEAVQRPVRRLRAHDSQHIGKGIDRGAARAAGSSCSPHRRTTPVCPTTRSSARYSAPTSSGVHAWPWRTPPPTRRPHRTCRCRRGTGTPQPVHRAAASPPSTTARTGAGRARSCCPARTSRSATSQHIKALFRDRDRRSMSFAFDLWSYQDVSANAEPILERLQAGSMPCDGAWPREKMRSSHAGFSTGKPG